MFNASAIESNLFIVAFILAFSSLLIYELSCPIINDNSSCLKPHLSRIFFKFFAISFFTLLTHNPILVYAFNEVQDCQSIL